MSETLSPEELDNMKHALGWPKVYRNHFVTDKGGPDGVIWMGLVERGLATRRDGSPLTGGDDLFMVTDAGKAALRAYLG